MDFICRSINSPKAFHAYITELEKEYNSEVIKVHLKNKKTGWQSLASQVCFANGKESHLDKTQDLWIQGFLLGDLYTRDACFHCKYRTLPRKAADITVGDFWGITGQAETDMFNGISAVLLNSEKGKTLFQRAENALVLAPHSLEETLSGNVALLHHPISPYKRDKFFRLLETKPFSTAVRLSIKDNVWRQIFRYTQKGLQKAKQIVRIVFRSGISVPKYIYYNYFCKNVVRYGTGKLIPYKNAVLDLKESSRIYLYGTGRLCMGVNKINGSRRETLLRMEPNAVWHCHNGGDICYDTVIEIKDRAVLDTKGYFFMNSGSAIVADKHISIGDDVIMGRNIIIYDSDFHQLRDNNNIPVNLPEPVVIEDHVWLTSNVHVLKGVTIGTGSLVGAQTVVLKDVPSCSMVAGQSAGRVISNRVNWNKSRNPRIE